MKTITEILKTRPIHHKVKIMNVQTKEHKMITEEDVRYIQTCIANNIISNETYVLVDKDGTEHSFDKIGRLTSAIKSNTLSYNDDMAMSLFNPLIKNKK